MFAPRFIGSHGSHGSHGSIRALHVQAAGLVMVCAIAVLQQQPPPR